MRYIQLDGFNGRFILEHQTIWFSQLQIASLFNKNLRTVNEHIKSIESAKPQAKKRFKVAQTEGRRLVQREKLHYSLDFVYNIGIKAREYEITAGLIEKSRLAGVELTEVKVLPIKQQAFCNLVKESLADIVQFEEQHRIGKYRVDLYCLELLLAIEYDETHHEKPENVRADIQRETTIRELIKGVTFIRVPEGNELQGLNAIIKYIMCRT